MTLVTGLHGEDFLGRVLVEVDKRTAAQWQQLVARPVKLDDLAVVPGDATLALAVNFEPSRLLSCLAGLQESLTGPEKKAESAAGADITQELMSLASGDLSSAGDLVGRCFKTNIVFDKELCGALSASLGDAWRLYTSPEEGSLVFLNITGVVRVKDRHRLANAFDRLAARKSARKPEAKNPQNDDRRASGNKADKKGKHPDAPRRANWPSESRALPITTSTSSNVPTAAPSRCWRAASSATSWSARLRPKASKPICSASPAGPRSLTSRR